MTTEPIPEWPRHIQPGDALCSKCLDSVKDTWAIPAIDYPAGTHYDPLALLTCVRCGAHPVRILVRDDPTPNPTT